MLARGYRDALSKPTSAIVGTRRGFAGNAEQLVGIQRGLPRRTRRINGQYSPMRLQEVWRPGNVTG